MARKAEVILEYQNYIETPPASPNQLYATACSSDGVTVEAWRQIWIDQTRANHKTHGPFKDRGLGKLFGILENKPAVIVGSGPSLKYNAHELKNKGNIAILSCLHNFHYLEDQGVDVDYYVSLDAGPVTIEEVTEGGSADTDYWAKTKGKKLIAFVASHPDLIKKWQGEIYFYNAPIPDKAMQDALKEIEEFHTYVSNGGNVLGACLYVAKGIMGANPIAFVGADFAFSYDKKFHAWNSKYDQSLGHVLKAVDVYGNKVLTWQSYFNFKSWFDFVAITVPGIYINCTEGGTFGAYPDGNIMAVRQMELAKFFEMYRMHEHLREMCENPATDKRQVLF